MAKDDVKQDLINATIGAAGGAALGGVAGRVMSRTKMQGGRGVFRRQARDGDIVVRDQKHADKLEDLMLTIKKDDPMRRKIAGALRRWRVKTGMTYGGAGGGAILGATAGGMAGRSRR